MLFLLLICLLKKIFISKRVSCVEMMLFLVIYSFFPPPVETVLHKAGSGADQGDGHRLRDESHLRHVCET